MPNNGIRIYTENGKGIDVRSDVYKVLGLAPRSNGYDVGYACANQHGKINPCSKRKPYAFGSAAGYTDAEAKARNWGMSPRQMSLPNSPMWGQWTPPVPGTNWMRLADFDGYNNAAVSPVHVRDLYFLDNGGKRMEHPTLGYSNSNYGTAYICADMEVTSGSDVEFGMDDFTNPYLTGGTFDNFCPTLVFGAWEGSEFSGRAWFAQTEETVQTLNGIFTLRIATAPNKDLYAYIVGGDVDGTEVLGQDGRSIGFVCLAPRLNIDDGEGNRLLSGELSYDGQDFWGNLFSLWVSPQQTENHYVKISGTYNPYSRPDASSTSLMRILVRNYNPGMYLSFGGRSSFRLSFKNSCRADILDYASIRKVTLYAAISVVSEDGKWGQTDRVALGTYELDSVGADGRNGSFVFGNSEEEFDLSGKLRWLTRFPAGKYTVSVVPYFVGQAQVGTVMYYTEQDYDGDDGIYDVIEGELRPEYGIEKHSVLLNTKPDTFAITLTGSGSEG